MKWSKQQHKGQKTLESRLDQSEPKEEAFAPSAQVGGNEEALLQEGMPIEPVLEEDSEHEVQIDLNPARGEVSYYGVTPAAQIPRNRLEFQAPLEHLRVDTAPQRLENDGITNRESTHLRVDPYEQPISKTSSIDFQKRFLVTRLQDSEYTSPPR